MLDKEIKKKIQKYNKIRSQADDLQYEIESYLQNNYYIDENAMGYVDGDFQHLYDIDSPCPIYEWGTRYFDIEMIEKIIKVYEDILAETGESPDNEEIVRIISEREKNEI